MHSTTGITDQFYSNINDEEKNNRIDSMFSNIKINEDISEDFNEFRSFLAWKKAK
jgi:hypothetical protein